MSKSLPKSWDVTTIGKLSVFIQYSYTAKAIFQDMGCKYLRITDINNNFVNWKSVPFCQIKEEDIQNFN